MGKAANGIVVLEEEVKGRGRGSAGSVRAEATEEEGQARTQQNR